MFGKGKDWGCRGNYGVSLTARGNGAPLGYRGNSVVIDVKIIMLLCINRPLLIFENYLTTSIHGHNSVGDATNTGGMRTFEDIIN